MALLDFPFTPRIILATSIVAVVGTYLYRKLYYIRFKQSAKLPQLPPSLLFGHLIKFHQLSKNHPADGHPGTVAPSYLSVPGSLTNVGTLLTDNSQLRSCIC